MKKKTPEVFTVSTSGLLASYFVNKSFRGGDPLLDDGWATLLGDGEIKEVRFTHDDEALEVTLCSPEVQPAELAELKAKQEEALNELLAKYKEGKITELEEWRELIKKEMDRSDFRVIYLEVYQILGSHLGRLPRRDEKITKAELDNGGVKFTMVRV